jgi:cytochrome c oxidase cbb3-type subunit 2
VHLDNPRDVEPESNMPAYAFLAKAAVDASSIQAKLRVLRGLGHPYTDEDIAGAPEALKDRSEQDALIAYLQGLGTTLKGRK